MSRMLNNEIHQQKPNSGPLGKKLSLILNFLVSKSKCLKFAKSAILALDSASIVTSFDGLLIGVSEENGAIPNEGHFHFN